MIQMGVDSAMAGDTVLVAGGTYYETVQTVRSGSDSLGIIEYIYIIAAGDAPAVIKAESDYCFLIGHLAADFEVVRHDFIWIEGFCLTNAYWKKSNHGAAVRTLSNYGVCIHNQIYDNDIGFFSEGTGEYSEATNNRGNFVAYNVFSDNGEAAVRLKHSSENDVVFNLFYNNAFRIEPAGCVTFYCGYGNRVINNTFWNNGGPAVEAYNGTASDSCVACANSEVRDNIFASPQAMLLLSVNEKTAWEGSSKFYYNLFWGPDSNEQIVWWGQNEYHKGGFLLTLSQFLNLAENFPDSVNPMNGVGCFFTDPLFENAQNLQFDLLSSSLAIDAGSRLASEAPFLYTPDSVLASELTARVDQSLDADTVDLGYHHILGAFGVNPQLDTTFGIDLYPNPYSGNGAILFTLPNVSYPRKIEGAIYDLLGRKVAVFRIPDDPFNQFRVPWDGRNLANGVYFVVLKVDGLIARNRILLIK